jgi:hypothetical protein
MVLQPEALIDCIVPEILRLGNIEIDGILSVVEAQWIRLHHSSKSNLNQPPFAYIFDGSAKLPGDEEQLVGTIDDTLSKDIRGRCRWNRARRSGWWWSNVKLGCAFRRIPAGFQWKLAKSHRQEKM